MRALVNAFYVYLSARRSLQIYLDYFVAYLSGHLFALSCFYLDGDEVIGKIMFAFNVAHDWYAEIGRGY